MSPKKVVESSELIVSSLKKVVASLELIVTSSKQVMGPNQVVANQSRLSQAYARLSRGHVART